MDLIRSYYPIAYAYASAPCVAMRVLVECSRYILQDTNPYPDKRCSRVGGLSGVNGAADIWYFVRPARVTLTRRLDSERR